MFSADRIELKTDDQIRSMRRSGLVVAEIHRALREAVRPGMTTGELDQVAASVLADHGATSNFLGYYGFTGNTCISPNEVIVHGVPGQRVIEPGDIVSFDCGAVLDGWHADACTTIVLDGGSDEDRRLSEITETAMWHGIAALARAKRIGEVGAAIEDYLETFDLESRPGLVREFIGHGIGSEMHMDPDVLNFRGPKGARVKPGLVVCIEPLLTNGSPANETLADDWTVVTKDGSHACHWEHMVAVHSRGIWVLTAPDGGVRGLEPFGITPVPLD